MVELVMFSMPTCPHCVKLKAHLKEEDIKYKLISIDSKAGEAKANEYGVTNFPTLFFVKDGIIVDAQVGFPPDANMREVLESYEN